MIQDRAQYYFIDRNKTCSETLISAANDAYGFGISEEDLTLFSGFGGGLASGSVCGALAGATAALSRLYGSREKTEFRGIVSDFVKIFQDNFGSINCGDLEPIYKKPDTRCLDLVRKTAELLDAYINKLEGKTPEAEPCGCTVSPEDIKRVKGLGFLNHKGTNKFNGRIITRNGKISAEEAAVIAEASKLYGDGKMMFTTRLTVEVSGIDYENIDAFIAHIGKVGLVTGGTGSLVRPVVSCKGTTCQYGLYDTYAVSEKIHERFYLGYHDVPLPHKFKIACGGCPNNCVKPSLNDLGIVGARIPSFDADKCKGCKKCQIEAACPIKIAKVEDGKLSINPEACNNCGRCIGKCPFGALEDGEYGFRVFIGGRWGKKSSHGQMLRHFVKDENELFEIIDKAILFFRSEGISGERFADTIARVGFEYAEEKILSNELLEKKQEILGMKVKGGASC